MKQKEREIEREREREREWQRERKQRERKRVTLGGDVLSCNALKTNPPKIPTHPLTLKSSWFEPTFSLIATFKTKLSSRDRSINPQCMSRREL